MSPCHYQYMYRGNFPVNRATHIINMHDDIICGIAQDAYALCRVFKKSAVGPKIGEQYCGSTSTSNHNHNHNVHHHQHHQINASDHSSSMEIYSSDGRCDDFESSINYPIMPSDNCSAPTMLQRFRSDHANKWTHFSCHDDTFNNFGTSSIQNYGSVSYPPSKVLYIYMYGEYIYVNFFQFFLNTF